MNGYERNTVLNVKILEGDPSQWYIENVLLSRISVFTDRTVYLHMLPEELWRNYANQVTMQTRPAESVMNAIYTVQFEVSSTCYVVNNAANCWDLAYFTGTVQHCDPHLNQLFKKFLKLFKVLEYKYIVNVIGINDVMDRGSPSLTTVNHWLHLIINLTFSLPPCLWLLGACERLSWSHW